MIGMEHCIVKKELLVPASVVFSSLASFIVALSIDVAFEDLVWIMLFFFIGVLVTTTLHELAHYLAIRVFAKQPVYFKFYPRYFAIVVIYRELFWNHYVVVALFPQLLIEAPLLLLYLATSNLVVLLVFIYHTFASLPDIVLSIRCILMFRNCRLRMFIENNRVRGFYVIKPSGDCVLYLF